MLREFVASKGLLLAITSLIAVGVMCFIYMRSAYYNLNLAKDQYYDQCRMADFWIDLKKVPLAELDLLAPIARRQRNSPANSVLSPRSIWIALQEPLNGHGALAARPCAKPIINDIVLHARQLLHRPPPQRSASSTTRSPASKDLHPGQWIHLLVNNRREELFIVGTAISSEFVYLMAPAA